jgi:thiol-disulfide isomerase/thioredoxin
MNQRIKVGSFFRLLFIKVVLLTIWVNGLSQKKVADFSFIDSEGMAHHLYKDYLDKKMVVVIDLFFVDCPPCNQIAPFLKSSYEFWGNGEKGVEFIALSPFDNDNELELYRSNHFLTYPFAGPSGGGDKVLEQFTNGFFGNFDGYPTLIIIRPDGTVIYDISSYRGDQETIDLLDYRINEVISNLTFGNKLEIFPNPSKGIPDIYFDAEPGDYYFKIHNSNGAVIHSTNVIVDNPKRIDLKESISNDLPSGSYFVALINKGGLVVQSKIVIL